MAFGADSGFGKLVSPFLSCGRYILFLKHLDILHHSFVSNEVVGRSADQRTFNLDAVVRTVKYFVDGIVRQLLNRSFKSDFVLLHQSGNLPEDHAVLILAQRSDCPFGDG